jgi:hypothetical protein
MSTDYDTVQSNLWSRKSPERTRPNRRAGGFYRTAEVEGQEDGGVPLTGIEHAVVAAVRMGYKVAEVQIDRSTRLAQRLRDAGDQAVGPDSARKAVDGAERLVFRAMMGGLTWLESAAAERGSPLRRLAEAEYRMLGSLFGLTESNAPRAPGRSGAATGPVETAETPFSAAADSVSASFASPTLEIRHRGLDPDRRPVRVEHFEIVSGASLPAPVSVRFYSVEKLESEHLDAEFVAGDKGKSSLTIATKRLAQTGTWRGAICDPGGLQLGYIEIIL